MGLPLTRLAAYEPPYMTDADREDPPSDYATRVHAAVDAGDPERAAEIFLEYLPPAARGSSQSRRLSPRR